MNKLEVLSGKEILNLRMQSNDANAETIRDYLKSLVLGVWRHGENFNAKRPFGNSDWEFELHETLLRANCIKGTIRDEDDQVEDLNSIAGDRLIERAIKDL